MKLICDLVKGDSSCARPEKMFLFDIVSNKQNSFDLDKLDYLNRDTKHTNINDSFINYKRIIKNAMIIDNRIAYNKKIYNDINMVYQRRYELFKQVYLHKTCQAIDFMVTDALIAANNKFKFEEVIFDPERYLTLIQDDLLRIIRKSRDPELQESAELLKRIERRDLYKSAGETLIIKDWVKRIKKEDIASCQPSAPVSQQLRPDDLIVHVYSLDWGNGDNYPLDNMSFYESHSTEIISRLPRHETS